MLLQEPWITACAHPTPPHKLWKPTFHDPDVACALIWASSVSLSLSLSRKTTAATWSVCRSTLTSPDRPSSIPLKTSLQRTGRKFSSTIITKVRRHSLHLHSEMKRRATFSNILITLQTTLFTSTFWNEETCYSLKFSNHFYSLLVHASPWDSHTIHAQTQNNYTHLLQLSFVS